MYVVLTTKNACIANNLCDCWLATQLWIYQSCARYLDWLYSIIMTTRWRRRSMKSQEDIRHKYLWFIVYFWIVIWRCLGIQERPRAWRKYFTFVRFRSPDSAWMLQHLLSWWEPIFSAFTWRWLHNLFKSNPKGDQVCVLRSFHTRSETWILLPRNIWGNSGATIQELSCMSTVAIHGVSVCHRIDRK